MLPLERFHNVVSGLLSAGEAGFNRQALLAKLDLEALTVACKSLVGLLPNAENVLLLGINEPVLCMTIANALKCPFVMVGDLDLISFDGGDVPEFAARDDLLQLALPERTLAVAKTAIPKGSNVIVFDEFLELGTESLALVHLAAKADARVLAVAALTEKTHLGARSRLQVQHVEVISLVQIAKSGDQLILEQRSNDHF